MAEPKNKVGKPLAFKSVEELTKKTEEYFDYCDNRVKSAYVEKLGGNVDISDPAPYTMSGLARYLGIDRDTLINYSHKEEYFGTIKAARMRVHEDVETRLMEGKAQTGAIFNLKNNFGWKDKTESEVTEKSEVLHIFKPAKNKE